MDSDKYQMASRPPLKEWSLGSSPMAVMLAFLLPGSACAHGVVGDRTFLSPIVGNDTFPDNAASITTRGSNYQFSLLPEIEKQLSDNSSLLFTGGWSR